MSRLKVSDIYKIYEQGKKFSCLSLYDSCFARLADLADIPLILVGDSLGTTILGYEDTVDVSVEDCLRHCSAVVRGSEKALVVGDLPFMTYHGSLDKGIEVARRFIQEAKVSALKLEGGRECVPIIKAIIQAGVPVMGHLGILPQRIRITEKYKVQGKTQNEARTLLSDALELQKAGVFALVLEGVKKEVAKKITEKLNIPTIGIGAGQFCSGQIQVVHDILGLNLQKKPKHAKEFIRLKDLIVKAFSDYKKAVQDEEFPSNEQSF